MRVSKGYANKAMACDKLLAVSNVAVCLKNDDLRN